MGTLSGIYHASASCQRIHINISIEEMHLSSRFREMIKWSKFKYTSNFVIVRQLNPGAMLISAHQTFGPQFVIDTSKSYIELLIISGSSHSKAIEWMNGSLISWYMYMELQLHQLMMLLFILTQFLLLKYHRRSNPNTSTYLIISSPGL